MVFLCFFLCTYFSGFKYMPSFWVSSRSFSGYPYPPGSDLKNIPNRCPESREKSSTRLKGSMLGEGYLLVPWRVTWMMLDYFYPSYKTKYACPMESSPPKEVKISGTVVFYAGQITLVHQPSHFPFQLATWLVVSTHLKNISELDHFPR